MKELQDWLQAQTESKRIKPNATLVEAFQYLLIHCEALTLFLR